MSFLNMNNAKIGIKIYALVGVLSVVAVVIAIVGFFAVKMTNDATHEVEQAGLEAAVAAQMTTRSVILNRAEYRLMAEPTPENLAFEKKEIHETEAEFEERLAKLESTAGPTQKKMLDEIRAAYDDYAKELEGTLTAAENQITGFADEVTARNAIREQVLSSEPAAKKVREALREFRTYAEEKEHRFAEEADKNFETTVVVLIAVSVLGILLGIVLAWIISQKGIVGPIRSIVECLSKLSNGDLSVVVYGTDRKDEIGEIAMTTEAFKENMVRTKELEAQQEEQKKQTEIEKRQTMNRLADEFTATAGKIVEAVSAAATEMQATAQSMSATAEETNRQASSVAAASEEASTNVQTVASAAEELSSSISEIGRQVSESTRSTSQAAEQARKTNDQVAKLAEAAQKVGDVVSLISDIAEQTNLLALNATIEAARAGEAGKGFAVVASEVKSLANQTAKATEEISAQIASIQGATGDAVQAIKEISTTIESINEIASTVAAAVEEQGAATQEIAQNVQQASAGTAEVSNNITGVTQAASETGNSANQVLEAATELSKQSEMLRGEVDKFLTGIRAA